MTAGKSLRVALVCMTPPSDTGEGAAEMPSYGIRRIQAALAADPALAQAEVEVIDLEYPDVQAYVERLNAFEPDLIGMSIYIWSAPCLIEVARRVKRRKPECAIVFGGPSARTAFFDLPPYANPGHYLDAVVASEGEVIFNEIARLPERTPAALQSISGLNLPLEKGWRSTGPRPPIADLDVIASPFQLGLMPSATFSSSTFRR